MSTIQTFIEDFLTVLEAANCDDPATFRDRVQIGLLQLFNQPHRRLYYQQRLLFRDFNAQPLHYQALAVSDAVVFYVDEVLWVRRLQLANHLLANPSNAHLLLARLCALHANSRWQTAHIQRYAQPDFIPTTFASFRATAAALAQHDQAADYDYSDVAMRREKEFGALYLCLEHSGAKVPAELSLAAIFSCCPQPLSPQFSQDSEVKKRLGSTVEHLNERYALLRACGLNPQQWLYKEVSDGQLRELKALREVARNTKAWADAAVEKAYREAFAALQPQSAKKKQTVASFKNYSEWSFSEVGEAMCQEPLLTPSMDRNHHPDDETPNDEISDEILAMLSVTGHRQHYPSVPPEAYTENLDDDEFTQPFHGGFGSLVELYPEVFTDVMAYLFWFFLDESDWRERVDDDAQFARLLAQDPDFKGLSGKKLTNRLWQAAEQLAAKHFIENQQ